MTKVIGIITARGGSKGLPGKNIRMLAGKPMIAWTIEAARASTQLDRVLVSTDSPDIAEVALKSGAEVPFLRPAELAEDTSSHISVIEHMMDWMEKNSGLPEYCCLLQPTSPLRTQEDIDLAIMLAEERHADAVVGVCEMERHPFLAKRIGPDGVLWDFNTVPKGYLRRQDFPPAYAINGAVYVNRCTSLRRDRTFSPQGAFAYVMPPERSLDVDTAWDFFLAEQVLKHRHAII